MKLEALFELVGLNADEIRAITRPNRPRVNMRILPKKPITRLACPVCHNPIGLRTCTMHKQTYDDN